MQVVSLWYRAPELLLGSENYTTAIDIWAIGCILGELLTYKVLVQGDTELDQIQRIFDLLGAPNRRIWPAIDLLPLVKLGTVKLRTEVEFSYSNLRDTFPRLSSEGLDLLNIMLAYDPMKRVPAKGAIRHAYFDVSPYPKEAELMPTFPTNHTTAPSGGGSASSVVLAVPMTTVTASRGITASIHDTNRETCFKKRVPITSSTGFEDSTSSGCHIQVKRRRES